MLPQSVRAFALAISFLSFAASAITIEPVAGGTPQATRINAFFPVDIAAIVRDDSGAPMAGVPVEFSWTGDGSFAFIDWNSTLPVTTGDDGVATPPNGVLAAAAGHMTLMATAQVAGSPTAVF